MPKRDPTDEALEWVSAVCERMREAREATRPKLSREFMAHEIGVSFDTIGNWERGDIQNGPPIYAVYRWARLTGVPVATILGEPSAPASLNSALMQQLFDRLRRVDREWESIRSDMEDLLAEPQAS